MVLCQSHTHYLHVIALGEGLVVCEERVKRENLLFISSLARSRARCPTNGTHRKRKPSPYFPIDIVNQMGIIGESDIKTR